MGTDPAPTHVGHVVAVGGKAWCAVRSVDTAPSPAGCFIPPNAIGHGLWFLDTPSHRTFQALVGADRFQTASDLADTDLVGHTVPAPANGTTFQESRGLFGLASGTAFADALTGGAALAAQHAPILLTARDYFPSATVTSITTWTSEPAPNTFEADIFGGPAAIAQPLQDALTAKVRP